MNIFKMLFGHKEVIERSEDYYTFKLNDIEYKINKKKYDRNNFLLLIDYFKEIIIKYKKDGFDTFLLNDKEFKISNFDLTRSFGIKYAEKWGDKIDISLSANYLIKINDKLMTRTSFLEYLTDGLDSIKTIVTPETLINRFCNTHNINVGNDGYYEINGGTHYITIKSYLHESPYRFSSSSFMIKDEYLIETDTWTINPLRASIIDEELMSNVLGDNPIIKKIDEDPSIIHWEKIAEIRLQEQKKFENRIDDFVKDIIKKFDRYNEMQLEYKTSEKLHYTSIIDSANFIHFCKHINHNISFDEKNIQKSLLRVLKKESLYD